MRSSRSCDQHTFDKYTCEFIASFPEKTLCLITAFPPSLDFAEPFFRHAVACEECAARINSVLKTHGKELHPELSYPEEEDRLSKRLLDLIAHSQAARRSA
jgi:hypothetical protein